MNKFVQEILKENKLILGVPSGSMVEAVVIGIDRNQITFDAGSSFKSEAVVSVKEFQECGVEIPAIGSKVNLHYAISNDRGSVSFSFEKAQKKMEERKLIESFNNKEVLSGVIQNKTKSGLIVKIYRFNGFLHYSQFNQEEVSDLKTGATLSVRILNLDLQKNDIKLSLVRGKESDYFVVFDGTVLQTESNDGKISVEISGNNKSMLVNKIEGQVYKIGESVKIKYKRDKESYELMPPKKQMDLKEHTLVKCVVMSQNENGIAVKILGEIVDGKWEEDTYYAIDGFIPLSEIVWSEADRKNFSAGEKIEAFVLFVDRSKKRINAELSLKHCGENLFKEFSENFKKNPEQDIIEGEIMSLTPYGVVIKIYINEKGKSLDGFLRLKDMSWNEQDVKSVNSSFVEKIKTNNRKIKIKILSLDFDRERVFLGLKQLEKDPLEIMLEKYPIGSVLEGVVNSSDSSGVFLTVDNKKSIVFVKKSTLSKEVEMNKRGPAIGEIVKAKVIKIDPRAGFLVASIKAYEIDCDKKAIEKYGEVKNQSMKDFFETKE